MRNTLPFMTCLVLVATAALAYTTTTASAHEDPNYKPDHDAPHLSPKALREKPGLMVGEWSGKWDRTWDVAFEIKEPDDKGNVSVIYKWRESFNDKQLSKQNRKGKFKDGKLRLGSITLEYKGPHSLLAIGRFGKNTRVAILESQKYPPTPKTPHHDHDGHTH